MCTLSFIEVVFQSCITIWFLGTTGLMLFKLDEFNNFPGYRGPSEQTQIKLVNNVKKMGDLFFNSGDLNGH